MTVTFEEIRRAAEAPDAPGSFWQFTMAAWEDAEQTVFVEKSRPAEEIDRVAMECLEALLSCTDDRVTVAYFTDLGVRL